MRNATMRKIEELRDKAIKIISFNTPGGPSGPLYKEMELLKLKDKISVQDCMLALENITNNQPETFSSSFKISNNEHMQTPGE